MTRAMTCRAEGHASPRWRVLPLVLVLNQPTELVYQSPSIFTVGHDDRAVAVGRVSEHLTCVPPVASAMRKVRTSPGDLEPQSERPLADRCDHLPRHVPR